jgi:histone deacetylase 11
MYPKIVYSPSYDIKFYGIEKLHAFDSCKYSKAWNLLEKEFGDNLYRYWIEPKTFASKDLLRLVHSDDYLQLLENSKVVAKALEIPLLGWFFSKELIYIHVLKPMLFAVMGTVIAAESALKTGISINLSGGYHHASKTNGEGFCIYSDIAVAIENLRYLKKLKLTDQVAIIDLDAHQGNGLERIFYQDENIHILDMYNSDVYPKDEWAKQRINCNIPLSSHTKDEFYLNKLEEKLPIFLKSIDDLKIVFYNAGTDVYEGDDLGMLQITEDGIFKRDKFVFDFLSYHNIPWVMLLSGGYSELSYKIIARSLRYVISKWANSNNE